MKIAVIDHEGNPGGGSRFVRGLLPAFKAVCPELEITYFGNPVSIRRESIRDEFFKCGIKVKVLSSLSLASEGIFGFKYSAKVIKVLQQTLFRKIPFLPSFLSGNVCKEIESRVKGFDIAFFPWPFLISVPDLDCPVIGTFHDLNFKYYFAGRPVFDKLQADRLNIEFPEWLNRSLPVVSSNFMANEITKFYPQYAAKVRVIHLASMSSVSDITENEARLIVDKFGIPIRYILYPTHLCSHKNVGPLLSALPLLKKLGHDISIVLTGQDTERVSGHAGSFGVELIQYDQDVIGLGYVTNLEMDSLVQCATVVVSTSLYEAGNGPGLDAWVRGVPVAMSNIPAFIEHLEVQDVKALIFDPYSPQDIANKIHQILSNPIEAKNNALHSQGALKKMNWQNTAKKYLQIFDEATQFR